MADMQDTSTKSPVPDLKDTDNLVQLFLDQVRQRGDAPFLWEKKGTLYQHSTWKEIATEINALARALMANGVVRGDRVAVISPNGSKSFIADMAIMMIGAVTVAVPRTWPVDDQLRALGETKAKAVLVGKTDNAEALIGKSEQLPDLTLLVCMEYARLSPSPTLKVIGWQDLITQGKTTPDRTREPMREIKPGDNACLIYQKTEDGRVTSVRHTHNGIIGYCRYALRLIERTLPTDKDVFYSVMPFAHVWGHTVNVFLPMVLGAQLYFAASAKEERVSLSNLHPTVLMGTSANLRSMREALAAELVASGSMDRSMMERALVLGKLRYESPRQMKLMQKLRFIIARAITRKRLRHMLGGHVRTILSVDNKADYATFLFFNTFDIALHEMEHD